MRILLAEDDYLIGEAVEFGLADQGWRVDWFKNGKDAELASRTQEYDLIILDIGLPELSGFAVLDEIRNQGKETPVLMLTAMDAIKDRVKGLDKGADDYLIKPFDMDELCARIRALSRRDKGRSVSKITHGTIIIHPEQRRIEKKGEVVDLPRREFELLLKLIQSPGRVFSHDELEEYLYSWSDEIESNTLQVFIHNIRKKLGKKTIRTLRGVGYVIDKEQ